MDKQTKNLNILKYIACIGFIIVLVIIFIVIKNLTRTTLQNESFYQYFSGEKFTYKGTIKLDQNQSNKITELQFKDVKVELDTTPIYYQNKKQVLFPKEMAIVYGGTGLTYKQNYYSTIYDDKGQFFVKNGKFKKNLDHVFLYDGDNLYFFLEQTKVKIDSQEFDLSPFSYVKVQYRKSIELYDYKTDKSIVLQTANMNDDIIATTGSYTIDLSIDSLKNKDKDQLLIKNMKFLKTIEK